MDLVKRQTNRVNKCLEEVSEAILNDYELTELASRLTSLGWHQLNLGHEIKNRQMVELGEHIHRMGGDLQSLALLRIKRAITSRP